MSLLSNKRKQQTLATGERAVDSSGHFERDSTSKRPRKVPFARAPPSTSGYMPITLGGSHWHGIHSLQNMVIFNSNYTKTWVEHLHLRIRGQRNTSKVQNFAYPGATAEEDLPAQLTAFFEEFPAKGHHNPTPALDQDSTTYLVFLGINDCEANGSYDLEPIVDSIFDALHKLYCQAGARNFVLFDVPPVDRSPQAIEYCEEEGIADCVETWNELLRTRTAEFGSSSNEATVLLFSSHQVLAEVLEDPLKYDLGEDDPTIERGGIWVDDLHLTSEVHDILGEQLFKSLFGL